METFECIKSRRSIRKYLDVPLPWDLVSNILEAGRLAPTAGNLQNFKFIIAFDKGLRAAVAEACAQQTWMAQAPLHIVICSDTVKAKRFYGIRGERLYSTQNSAAAAMTMLLAAHNFGLGGCWVGAFDENMIKRIFGIPDDIRPQVILTIGYADEKPRPPIKASLENFVYFQGWRAKIADPASYFGWPSVKVMQILESGKGIIMEKASNLKEKTKELVGKIKDKTTKE